MKIEGGLVDKREESIWGKGREGNRDEYNKNTLYNFIKMS